MKSSPFFLAQLIFGFYQRYLIEPSLLLASFTIVKKIKHTHTHTKHVLVWNKHSVTNSSFFGNSPVGIGTIGSRCTSKAPCRNRGVCVRGENQGSFKCQCKVPFLGASCEESEWMFLSLVLWEKISRYDEFISSLLGLRCTL